MPAQFLRDLNRKPRFADACRSGEREQARPIRLQEVYGTRHFLFTSNQGGRRKRNSGRTAASIHRRRHFWPHHCYEQGPLLHSQVQSGQQQLERVVTRKAVDTPLKISNCASAQSSAGSEGLLCETRRQPVTL